jgi:hypothetical protein
MTTTIAAVAVATTMTTTIAAVAVATTMTTTIGVAAVTATVTTMTTEVQRHRRQFDNKRGRPRGGPITPLVRRRRA